MFIKNKIIKMFSSFCGGTSYSRVKKKMAKNLYLGVTAYTCHKLFYLFDYLPHFWK